MVKSIFVLTALVFFSGFGSIHSITKLDSDGTEESSGDCSILLPTVQMSQKQLDKLDVNVQSIIPHLKESIEVKFYKLLEKIEHFIESKFDEVNKKIDSKFLETKNDIGSKLSMIEDKISEHNTLIDSQFNGLESTLTNVLNVNNNNACCQVCFETTAFVKNTTTDINDMNIRTLNITLKLQDINETIKNLTAIVEPSIVRNISKQNDTTESTEPAINVSDIITTTEINKPAPSKCDRSQREECCTAAVVGHMNYTEYTEMSARGRHTVVNMTSAGLQEYTMYFAVRGEGVYLLLTPTSPYNDLYYGIVFGDDSGGNIYVWERLPADSERLVHDLYTTNIISTEHYTYYYLRISGDTLEVGRRGEPPLMTYTSSELRRLRYFSFAWWYSAGAALYDCPVE